VELGLGKHEKSELAGKQEPAEVGEDSGMAALDGTGTGTRTKRGTS
jgi:hypothetical protein